MKYKDVFKLEVIYLHRIYNLYTSAIDLQMFTKRDFLSNLSSLHFLTFKGGYSVCCLSSLMS